MADNNKFPAIINPPEETQSPEGNDEFDPFSGVTECVDEHVDSALTAPPERHWYHGRLDRQSAEERLRAAGEVGCYLVRESENKPGSFVLSYLGKKGLNHFRVICMCGDFYIGGRQFASLSDLIGYYTSISCLLEKEQLQMPIAPPEPVDDSRKVVAVLPYKKMPDTDELSFEKGDIFTIIQSMGEGWMWVQSHRNGECGLVNVELVEDLNGNFDPVESLPYFHGNTTKESAVDKLKEAGDGSYLIRPSDQSPGDYTLFFLFNKVVQRFRIEKQGRQFFMGGRFFDSLDAIVKRYEKEEIVDGYTLLMPVQRDTKDYIDGKLQSLDLENVDKTNDIYASIRHSTVSSLVRSKNDRIDMTGFLNKKSQRNKKWKNMYFVLNGTEAQLFFFENEKRSKPKGLIDLSFSSLYPVHDSFFGRPNCFQIVINAYDPLLSLYYLCAENSDTAQKWVHTLKAHCVNTPIKSKDQLSSVLKELRSLHVQIFDGRNLHCKQLLHPYCILSLNTVKTCRTTVQEHPNPFWGDEFHIEDIPADIDSFTISVYNHGKRSKDTEIAQITINLHDIEGKDLVDEWYQLQPVLPAPGKMDQGSLRIAARYLHECIMPVEEYTSLKQLIIDRYFDNIVALSKICHKEKVSLAKAFLRIFRHERHEALLLKTFNDMEIDETAEVTTLFRATTPATTLMDQYMKMTATSFVKTAVHDCIQKIVDSKQSCELNPTLVEHSGDLTVNADHLIQYLNEITDSTCKSAESCPVVLRYICGCLQRRASTKWPDDDSVRTRVVSGFVFLRLLCPAILNPKSFNLITETPSEVASRTLKLVAKSLQNLANLVEFKEPYMNVVNPFIKKNKTRMIEFLNELSNVHDYPTVKDHSPFDLARDLATIHQICASHLPELRRESERLQSLKKLVAVTEMLTNHKKCYLGDT